MHGANRPGWTSICHTVLDADTLSPFYSNPGRFLPQQKLPNFVVL